MKSPKPLKTLDFQSDRRGSIPLRVVDCFRTAQPKRMPETADKAVCGIFYAQPHAMEVCRQSPA